MAGTYDRKDHFYKKAKDEGFRSRAAFKLMELQERFRFFSPGKRILELGAWPGGWTQVACGAVGESGLVVGVDLLELDPLAAANVKTIKGDIRDSETLAVIRQICLQYDCIISDMAPNLSGIPEVDRVQSVGLAELTIWVARQVLVNGGDVILKMFQSNEAQLFVKESRKLFNMVQRVQLQSTRKSSSEFYFVGQGFKCKQ